MRKPNRNEKILLIAVAVIVALYILKSFVLGPIYEKINIYSEETEHAKMNIRRYLSLEHNRVEILKAQKQIEGYSLLRGKDEDKTAMIMSKVEAEARKSKLQILDMNFAGVTKAKGGVNLYRINLRSEGQLKNILDFISRIEEANILLRIEKIAISVKDETEGSLKMDGTILGVSFL